MFFGYYLHFFPFYYEDFEAKIAKHIFYQKYVHLGKNTLIYCSQKTVVHVHVNGFLKNSIEHAKVMQMGSNQEVTKMTYKHAAEFSKAVCWDVN